MDGHVQHKEQIDLTQLPTEEDRSTDEPQEALVLQESRGNELLQNTTPKSTLMLLQNPTDLFSSLSNKLNSEQRSLLVCVHKYFTTNTHDKTACEAFVFEKLNSEEILSSKDLGSITVLFTQQVSGRWKLSEVYDLWIQTVDTCTKKLLKQCMIPPQSKSPAERSNRLELPQQFLRKRSSTGAVREAEGSKKRAHTDISSLPQSRDNEQGGEEEEEEDEEEEEKEEEYDDDEDSVG